MEDSHNSPNSNSMHGRLRNSTLSPMSFAFLSYYAAYAAYDVYLPRHIRLLHPSFILALYFPLSIVTPFKPLAPRLLTLLRMFVDMD